MPNLLRPRSMVALAVCLVIPGLAAPPADAAKPRRGIVTNIVEIGHSDRFIIKGWFKQTYRRGPIIVQQRFHGGRWTAYTKARSTSSSRFRIRVEKRGRTGDIVCYRLVVPGDRKFQRASRYKASTGPNAGSRFCIETTFG